MTTNKTIQAQAMLVFFTVSQWTARKFDKKATQETNAAHGTANAGRFHKILIAEQAIKKVQQAATAARKFHEAQTTPYIYKGAALLSAKNYFNYCQGMRAHQQAFNTAAAEVVDNYDAMRQRQSAPASGAQTVCRDWLYDRWRHYKSFLKIIQLPS